MARISRVVASGYPHHVTQRGVRSIPIFHTDSDRRAYLHFMAEELNRFGVEVLAWCLPERRFGEEPNLLGLVEDWAEYLKGNEEWETQTTLLRGIRTGRPAGSAQFVEMIERLTGRDLAMRKAGRLLKHAA